MTGKNFDHRKVWIEDRLQQLAAAFGIDLLAFSCLSNHFHLILRSRPDVVATWDDTEVARRWLLLCPVRKSKLPPDDCERVNALAAKAQAGSLTADERTVLDVLLHSLVRNILPTPSRSHSRKPIYTNRLRS